MISSYSKKFKFLFYSQINLWLFIMKLNISKMVLWYLLDLLVLKNSRSHFVQEISGENYHAKYWILCSEEFAVLFCWKTHNTRFDSISFDSISAKKKLIWASAFLSPSGNADMQVQMPQMQIEFGSLSHLWSLSRPFLFKSPQFTPRLHTFRAYKRVDLF